MEYQDSAQLHEWGQRVSRLLELIAVTSQTLQQQKLHGSPEAQIRDYQGILTQHETELNQLMQAYGLTISIQRLESAA